MMIHARLFKIYAYLSLPGSCPDVSRGAISGKKTYIATQEGLVFIYKLNISRGIKRKTIQFQLES